MKVAVALPEFLHHPDDLKSIWQMLAARFAGAQAVAMCEAQDIPSYKALLEGGDWPVTFVSDAGQVGSVEHYIDVLDKQERESRYRLAPGSHKIYKIGKNRRLHLTNSWLDTQTDPYVSHHVFNHCTPPTAEPLFAFAPYTYLFRYPGIGQYNQYGHRVPGDYHLLAERDAQHKVIAVFGGSACWSIFCYDHEVFTHRLEKKLNESSANGLRFTVLNFGLPGNITLNESITYLLHCHRIKPDIVIGHDGFNDMFYGATADANLVRNHDIVYQFNLEEWAHTIKKDWYSSASQPLAENDREQLKQPGWPLTVQNLPQDIIAAYCRRKKQFREIVEQAGAYFIWGIQPYLHSKRSLSPVEQDYLAGLSHDTTVRDIYRRIPFLYEKLGVIQRDFCGEHLINFDDIFTDMSEQETHFADFCHLTPMGDELLAERYFQHIRQHIVPNLELRHERKIS